MDRRAEALEVLLEAVALQGLDARADVAAVLWAWATGRSGGHRQRGQGVLDVVVDVVESLPRGEDAADLKLDSLG